jgi:hypothetical protein
VRVKRQEFLYLRNQLNKVPMAKNEHKKYNYFVDNDKYESESPTITGALIKVSLPESKKTYSLYLEGHGNDADQLINDNDTVSLEQGAKHFYTVPPASFGLA